MLRDVWSQFVKYFRPSNLFMGFGFVIAEWHRSDVKNRALLLLIFAPMFACMLGFLFSFANFVFAFISKLLGWFILTALFGAGGIFCYEKLREIRSFSSEQPSPSSCGTSSSAYNPAAKDGPNGAENVKDPNKGSFGQENKRKKWFDGIPR
ncbi:MAG: hypothetical protein LBP21_03565 [Synergistaceae bacterium]|nr:hypothetical protein [Synergistaceae bacterium]